jgi:type II secretory ATPase GspE/PulE/Tfp pilus assembly ATPase PilB-like protein
MIHRAAAAHELREQMRKNGGLSLREEGVILATEGKLSLEEALGVTHNEDVCVRSKVAGPKLPEVAA